MMQLHEVIKKERLTNKPASLGIRLGINIPTNLVRS
jgi:hypothetical protein